MAGDGSLDGVAAFAVSVGSTGPVRMLSRESAAESGDEAVRPVFAPRTMIDHRPADMVVEVDAGTPIAVLCDVLAAAGQRTILDGCGPPGTTVGAVLGAGRSSVDRLGDGSLTDALLGASLVLHNGRVATIGGQTVKNVTGYDLCRLVVGSRGTLGFLARVILRTRPVPHHSVWVRLTAEPTGALAALDRPNAILHDLVSGTLHVHLCGGDGYVAEQLDRLSALGQPEMIDGPPELPAHRWSLAPASVAGLSPDDIGDSLVRAVKEVGVGIVHADRPAPSRTLSPSIRSWHQALWDRFDPAERLNPGERRRVLS